MPTHGSALVGRSGHSQKLMSGQPGLRAASHSLIPFLSSVSSKLLRLSASWYPTAWSD